jgi:serine/threonine-protein kinase
VGEKAEELATVAEVPHALAKGTGEDTAELVGADNTLLTLSSGSEASPSEASPAAPVVDEAPSDEALDRAQLEQARRMAITGLVLDAAALVSVPFFGGDPIARTVFIGAVLSAVLMNCMALVLARENSRSADSMLLFFYGHSPVVAGGVCFYTGVFGPLLVLPVINLYSTCLHSSRRYALSNYVGSVVVFGALHGLILLGVIADPGLIRPDGFSALELLIAALVIQLFFALTYAQGRSTRKNLVAAVSEMESAVRAASLREAMFVEAREELERALQAGGMGRYTEQTVGAYKLGALLGRGGMGEVYAAQALDSGQDAAVKLLQPAAMREPGQLRRFLRELQVAKRIHSPHIVKVFDVADESAPLPFIAMELLEGDDLSRILREVGRLNPTEVAELVRQVAVGIEAAHAEGVVHRDLKPQNVFRVEVAGKPLWKVLDFGVSKVDAASGTLTADRIVGTPQYMAPEQALGEEVDHRVDCYALAAIAYRALTGVLQFRGREIAAILHQVVYVMPKAPSALGVRPTELDVVLQIAMAKDPAARFSSPREFSEAFTAATRGVLSKEIVQRAKAVESWRYL